MTAVPPYAPADPNDSRNAAQRPAVLTIALPEQQRRALEIALGNLGFRVEHATNGAGAVAEAPRLSLVAVVIAVPLPDGTLRGLLDELQRAAGDQLTLVFYADSRAAADLARAERPDANVCVVGAAEFSRLALTVATAVPAERRPRPDRAARRVLIAADDPVHRKLLQLRLLRLGFAVITAEDGNEALERARRHRPDAVIADVLMPGLDGFQLCLALHQEPSLRAIPVVLSTAGVPDELDLLLAQNVGANALVLRSQDRADELDALFAALHDGAPAPQGRPAPIVFEQHAHRMIRQLERQVGLLRIAERALRESEERYRLVLDGANDGIWDWDIATDELYWNPRLFEIAGLDPASFPGTLKGTIPLVHPDDRVRLVEARVAHLTRGVPYDVEFRLKHRAGGWRTVITRGKAHFDDAGRPVRMAGTVVDVTAARRAASEQQFISAVTTVLGPTLDVDATLPTVVALAAEYFGGPCAIDALEQREPLRRFAFGGEIPADAESIPLQVRERRAGTLFIPPPPDDAVESMARTSTANELARRISAALDAAWLYRRAREAVHARDEFLSIASHELKTPLTSLQLHVQALLAHARANTLGQLEPTRVTQKLDTAERQTRRLTKLVNELLDVSRIVNGRLELTREAMDLSAAVREIVGRYADEAQHAGSAVSLDVQDGIVGQWDRLRIEQVIVNLLSNAVKYGDAKPIAVTLAAAAGRATITVRDQGIGIAPDRLPHIFDRFERAVSARHYGGLGLGLYIVRQIVDAHGGTIHVESEPDTGSVFTVVLPIPPDGA